MHVYRAFAVPTFAISGPMHFGGDPPKSPCFIEFSAIQEPFGTPF